MGKVSKQRVFNRAEWWNAWIYKAIRPIVVRSVLNIKFICKYSGQNLRDFIERKSRDNEMIMRAWNVLSRSITNETLINSIKKQMITKWIDVRGKSFVNAYIEVLKHRINSHTSDGGIKVATTRFNKKTIFLCEPQFS